MDAILWFIELLTETTPSKSCLKTVVGKLVLRWYGQQVRSDFERCYADLISAGFIGADKWSNDRRHDVVWLTERGKVLLSQIKEVRYQDMGLLREEVRKLPRKDKQVVLRLFARMSDRAWAQMLEDVDPENEYELLESGRKPQKNGAKINKRNTRKPRVPR